MVVHFEAVAGFRTKVAALGANFSDFAIRALPGRSRISGIAAGAIDQTYDRSYIHILLLRQQREMTREIFVKRARCRWNGLAKAAGSV